MTLSDLSLEQRLSEVEKQWQDAQDTIKALEAVAGELNKTIADQNRTIQKAHEALKEAKADYKELKLHYVEFNGIYTKHLESKKLDLFHMTQKAFKLSEAFCTYAGHLRDCDFPDAPCSCGLQDLELDGVKVNGAPYPIGKKSKPA